MTEAHTHEHAEKAPAKKRATRKKVVHVKTHAELERDAFVRKLDAIFATARDAWDAGVFPAFNQQQVKALQKKIARREFQITLQSVAKS